MLMPPECETPDLVEDTFETAFPARTEEVAPARRSFSVWLHRRTHDDVADELEIVFSELAANAVDASPADDDEVEGRAWCEGSDVVIDIANRTDPVAAADEKLPSWDLDDPLRTGGRGLVITEAFVDSMEVTLEPGQKLVVRCRRRID